jgi:hypothetical protein
VLTYKNLEKMQKMRVFEKSAIWFLETRFNQFLEVQSF